MQLLRKGNKGLESGKLTMLNERYSLAEVHILDLDLVFILLF